MTIQIDQQQRMISWKRFGLLLQKEKIMTKLVSSNLKHLSNREQITDVLINCPDSGWNQDGGTKKETVNSFTAEKIENTTRTVFSLKKYFVTHCFFTSSKFPHSWQFTMKNYPFQQIIFPQNFSFLFFLNYIVVSLRWNQISFAIISQ